MSKYVLAKDLLMPLENYAKGMEVKYNVDKHAWMLNKLYLTSPFLDTEESGLARLIAEGWVVKEKQKVKKEGWINIYFYDIHKSYIPGTIIKETKEEAQMIAEGNNIIDTIKIEWYDYE